MPSGIADTSLARPAPGGVLGHVHFWWLILWTAVFILPLVLMQIVTHAFDPTARNFKRWAGLWSRLVLMFAGIRVRCHQSVPLEAGQPYVFVSNHQTGGLDIWSNLVGIDHPFGFVAKDSLRKVPLLGLALRFSACLFVDRSSARKAVKSIAEAAERIRTGNSVLIYPEGRRSWGPHTDEFMKGAYQLAVKAGVPIVPIALINAYELFDERAKASRPGTVQIVVGKPLETSGTHLSDVPDLVDATRNWIQDCISRYHRDEPDPFKTDDGSVSSLLH
jgi:1-acyl-sn-glycerol-3-phosphate acyltransferase